MLLRRIALVVPSAILAAVLVASCSKQSEGERCDVLNNDDDCDGGLECVAASELLNSEADRCCPPEGDRIGDDRCRRRTGGTTSTGGAGGASSTGGSAGSVSGAGAAGRPGNGGDGGDGGTALLTCRYPSDCPDGQTCGPNGRCQAECQTDRDCFPGQTCSAAGACENAGTGGATSTGGRAGTAGQAAAGRGGAGGS